MTSGPPPPTARVEPGDPGVLSGVSERRSEAGRRAVRLAGALRFVAPPRFDRVEGAAGLAGARGLGRQAGSGGHE